MPIPQLPVELWQAICRLCDPVEICNLRLTCRVLREVGDEFLLDAVTPYYHRKDLERVRAITKAPLSIRKGISEFLFFLDRLEPFDNFDAWDEVRGDVFNGNDYLASEWIDMRSRQDERPRDVQLTMNLRQFRDANRVGKRLPFGPLMQERYRRYCELIRYQSQLERGSNLREMLSAFFKACPNLRHLQFCIKYYFPSRMLDETFQSGLIIPRGSSDGGDLAFKETILAAHDAGFHPQQLTILYLHTCLNLFDDAFLEKASEMLQDLTALHWSFLRCSEDGEPWFDIEGFNATLADRKLVKFLEQCPRLETLDLMGPDREGRSRLPEMAHLGHLVGGLFWPNLRNVTLSMLRTTSRTLTGFLLRHKDTLRGLTLGDLYLSDDSHWAQCFAVFAGELPALEMVHLYGAFHSAVHEFTDYIWEDDAHPRYPGREPFEQWIVKGGEGPPYPPGQTLGSDD